MAGACGVIPFVHRKLISSGLAAKGYTYVNVDEGWLLGRDATTHKMLEDKTFFPSGMKGLGEWIHNLTVPGKGKIMKYGLCKLQFSSSSRALLLRLYVSTCAFLL